MVLSQRAPPPRHSTPLSASHFLCRPLVAVLALGLPTAGSLTLSWSGLANALILLGQASLSRAERELDQMWGEGRTAVRVCRGQTPRM